MKTKISLDYITRNRYAFYRFYWFKNNLPSIKNDYFIYNSLFWIKSDIFEEKKFVNFYFICG